MPKKQTATGSTSSAGSQIPKTLINAPIARRPQQPVFGAKTVLHPPVATGASRTQNIPGIPASALANGGNSNVWKNGGGQSLVRNATTRVESTTPSQMASDLASLNINSTAVHYTPSEGPTPAAQGGGGKVRAAPTTQAASNCSTLKDRAESAFCKLSRWTRRDFRHGDIISIPYHTPNLNPYVQEDDSCLTYTDEGYVYSKRRMLIVLWIHQQDLFCVPLFSFGGKGIRGKPEWLRKEYVSVRNKGDKKFDNQGPCPPVDVVAWKKPMHPMTAVQITGGTKVNFSEDIAFCGRTTEDGYNHLLELWNELWMKAQGEVWRN
ncbi:hypothetical protein LTR10_010800 [Elasticomyces elasticus]|nr:hypothetical protein LTR10_010800 [Elasticomyces elasticus]